MPDDRRILGKDGESLARDYLKSRAYRILETNFRTRFAEIDIIALDKETLCFVEVKTRHSLKKGLPRESVTPAKQKKIIQAASFYLKDKKITDTRVRFDVVEVITAGKSPRITLIRHAFQAG